jgi:hypothetical protein
LIVAHAKLVIAYSNEIEANRWSGIWYGTCSRSISDESAIVRLARGLTEEEKVDTGDKLQNLLIRSGEQCALQSLFGLPVVKHRQQISTGSGLESHQGRLDPDSRPGAEKFRASSS